ncbi:MAG TPA: hypothetical protein VLW65_01135 [Bryobacteraceae bacterium]|nr:hypothetical protein [Bryobacteraceae bacterium]
MMTSQKLRRRYRSGYWAGSLINAVGILITLCGIVLAVAVVAFGIRITELMTQNQDVLDWINANLHVSASQQYTAVGSMTALFAAILFLLFWLAGTFVSALAQILKALLDTAVNTSPLLSLEEKQNAIR